MVLMSDGMIDSCGGRPHDAHAADERGMGIREAGYVGAVTGGEEVGGGSKKGSGRVGEVEE